jgi:hypothetical protein
MTESKQAQELNRAAERLAAVTRELASTLEWLVEYERVRHPERLTEEELGRLVDEEVHAVRAELWSDRKPERPAPSEEEIEEWEQRRRERRKAEPGEGA